MNAVRIVLLVAFILVCFFLVLLVLFQDDGQSGMGGLLGGRGTAAFGSHSASVLTRATFVLVVLFFSFALSLALFNKRPRLQQNLVPVQITNPDATVQENQSGSWWQNADEPDQDAVNDESVASE